MAIKIKINGEDKTSSINNVSVSDNLFSDTDECSFTYIKFGDMTFVPEGYQEVEVYDGTTKIFGGRIIKIDREVERPGVERFNVSCKDYVEDMDGYLAVEDYQEKTVEFIINDLVEKYLPGLGFTTNNVNCTIEINRILFDAKPISKCIDELAQYTNYQWYIDPDKDIHFFARGTEVAPFNLTDDNGSYIFSSLRLTEDYSQIINSILVEGGTFEGETVKIDFKVLENDIDEERKEFSTIEKFAKMPKVYVNDIEKTVGVNNLDEAEDFDVLWDYQQQLIKFKDDTRPGLFDKITLVGPVEVPALFPAIDQDSITKYGKKEVKIIDKSIKSFKSAIQRASAELEAYKEKLNEGSFTTYNSGLRSGQWIHIQSDLRGIDQYFVIKKVSFRMKTYNSFEYNVDLITQKTMGLVDFLQKQILDKDKELDIPQNPQLIKFVHKDESLTITEENTRVKSDVEEDMTPDWVFGPYAPKILWANQYEVIQCPEHNLEFDADVRVSNAGIDIVNGLYDPDYEAGGYKHKTRDIYIWETQDQFPGYEYRWAISSQVGNDPEDWYYYTKNQYYSIADEYVVGQAGTGPVPKVEEIHFNRDIERVNDIEAIKQALYHYYQLTKTLPNSLSQLVPDYITEIPKDPLTSNDYDYAFNDNRFVLRAIFETQNKYLDDDYDGTILGLNCNDDGKNYCIYDILSRARVPTFDSGAKFL